MDLQSFLLDLGISAILTTLKLAFKDEGTKKNIRKVMLKVWTQIGIVFGNDPEFVAASEKWASE